MDFWIKKLLENMNNNDFISFKDVSVTLDQIQPLFEHLTCNIKKNSLTLLIGPTGSGKTTILRLIKGIIPYLITTRVLGSIFINGIEKTEKNFFRQSLDIGYLFQDFDLQFIGSTVEEELIFSLENMGQPRDIIRERLDWFLKKYPLFQSILHRNPHTLSGGELAQVVFISTIIADPDILLLDEPLENLDSISKTLFLELLHSYKGKKTIVISSHDIASFIDLTDEILVLSKDDKTITQYPSKASFLNNVNKYPWANLSPLARRYYLHKIEE